MKIDKNLVYIFSEESRIQLKTVSRLLRKSSPRLKYALNVLVKEKIIKSKYAIFDYSYFGLMLFKVFFRGAYVGDEDKKAIINRLTAHPYVVAIYELIGEFDLTVEFACPNPSRFNKELKLLSGEIKALNDYMVLLNLVTYLSPKRYLIRRQDLLSRHKHIIIGGDREVVAFTQQEKSVIRALLKNPEIRLSRFENITGMNKQTIKKVWKSLEDREIIKGFKAVVDTSLIGAYKFRLFLRFHNISPEREERLLKSLLDLDEAVKISKTIGDWNMEVDVESVDRTRIRSIMFKMREEFKDLIERLSLIEIYDHTTRQYLPEYVFS